MGDISKFIEVDGEKLSYWQHGINSKYISITVDGYNLTVYPEVENGGTSFAYAVEDCGWYDGIFDSLVAVIKGFRLSGSENGFKKMAAMRDRINSIENENRLITCNDFDDESQTQQQLNFTT